MFFNYFFEKSVLFFLKILFVKYCSCNNIYKKLCCTFSVLRRETSETERTFNEINTSPTLFGQPEEGDMMQSESPPQKSRRGRKRQSDEV